MRSHSMTTKASGEVHALMIRRKLLLCILVVQLFLLQAYVGLRGPGCHLLYSQTSNHTVFDIPEGRTFQDVCQCTGSNAQPIEWTRNGVNITSNFGEVIPFLNGISSLLKVKNISLDMEGVICCRRGSSSSACVTIEIHKRSSSPTLSVTLVNIVKSSDQYTEKNSVPSEVQVKVQCKLKAYSKYKLVTGSLYLLVNGIIDFVAYDSDPRMQTDKDNGTRFWTMTYTFLKRASRGDSLGCQWIDQEGNVVTSELIVETPSQTPRPALTTSAAYTQADVHTTSQTEDHGRQSEGRTSSTSDITTQSTGQGTENQVVTLICISIGSVVGGLGIISVIAVYRKMSRKAKSPQAEAVLQGVRRNDDDVRRSDSLQTDQEDTAVDANVENRAVSSRDTTRPTSPVNADKALLISDHRSLSSTVSRNETRQRDDDDNLRGGLTTTTLLQKLSPMLGDSWTALGRRLGILDPKLQNIRSDERGDQQEMAYKMLLWWVNKGGATRAALRQAIGSLDNGRAILDTLSDGL